ncbi:DUF2332 domain-containing protein [Octadecabacter sp. R77987]|uniref:DUF2332 domain-containing protein n=1 Tax=Octadecabacter sp. R77987 TaxID=3093874 RepID=UPI00366BB040
MIRDPDDLRAAFRFQAVNCAALGSPFMAQLCNLLADHLQPDSPLTLRMFNWPGDLTPGGESVPLRLCGALHALRLEGRAGLADVYPPHQPDDNSLKTAIFQAMDVEGDFITAFIDSPPQTNEVRRSAALIAAGHWLADRFRQPMVTSELGASAGLNLNWDRYGMVAQGRHFGAPDPILTLHPTWDGPLPPDTAPQVVDRAAVDLNPLDPQRDSLRPRAYLWPDQPERMALTNAALAPAQMPDKGDAIDWLEPRLATPHDGHLHLIYHTIAWQYFPPAVQARGAALITAAGARATDAAPLAWLGLEGDEQTPGAALTLRIWPGDGAPIHLGRVDFHGRWIQWAAP